MKLSEFPIDRIVPELQVQSTITKNYGNVEFLKSTERSRGSPHIMINWANGNWSFLPLAQCMNVEVVENDTTR